jgi:hypothetical protein
MEKLIENEQSLEEINQVADQRLDDQSFFNATESLDVKMPTEFIMKRMMRWE